MGITLEEKSKYVPLTRVMIDALLTSKQRTGYSAYALYSYGRANTKHAIFHQTAHTMITGWMNGKTKSVNPDDYEVIVSVYERLPSVPARETMTFTKEHKQRLLTLKDVTGFSSCKLYQYGQEFTEHAVFKNTTESMLSGWFFLSVETVKVEDYKAILDVYLMIFNDQFENKILRLQKLEYRLVSAYERLSTPQSTQPKQPINIPITDEFRQEIKSFFEAPRQLTMSKLLAYSNAPKGLTSAKLKSIVLGTAHTLKAPQLAFLEKIMREK
jgi:hypothetical protein